jgi:hypothetical protein
LEAFHSKHTFSSHTTSLDQSGTPNNFLTELEIILPKKIRVNRIIKGELSTPAFVLVKQPFKRLHSHLNVQQQVRKVSKLLLHGTIKSILYSEELALDKYPSVLCTLNEHKKIYWDQTHSENI